MLKPGNAVGLATAVVFRKGAEGSWVEVDRLDKLPGGFPGEALISALAAGGDQLLLGSGDPKGVEAGHLYERVGGQWLPRARLPIDPTAVGTLTGLPPGGLDMATLSQLMGPPQRTIAFSPDGSRLAVAGGSLAPGQIHVLDRVGDEWRLVGTPTVESSSNFPPALAVDAGQLVVGVPQSGPGGAVHIFSEADGWAASADFVADSSASGGLYGASVALSAAGDEVYVSAPVARRVVRLARTAEGAWSATDTLTAPPADDEEGTGYGTGLALDGDRLLVSAPFTGGALGKAYLYQRDADGWTLERELNSDIPAPATFGLTLAMSGNIAVVGAPVAFGGDGRAAVFDLTTEDGPVWLESGAELETVSGDEPVRCAEGEAAGFSCDAVDLVSFLPLSAIGAEPGERVTDVWGWTDPETGREYVLLGRTAGLAIVDITNAGSPNFVGLMRANPSGARDIKVYADHAFMTGDGAGDHGLLVFDLTRLRDVDEMPAAFQPDARYDLVASAHNLVIDTESGFAYTVGTNTGGQSCGGGLHMIDIRDPLQPAFAGCFTDTEGLIWSGRTHDAQCTVYRGPDENYQGRQICFASNETAMRIVDVTDKSAPQPISTASHPGTAYIHQGWLTEDHRYLYVNDELDEIVGTTERTRTLIYDVAELDDPILIGEHLGPDRATDHNLFISGTRAYLANYQAGFRVLDISNPESPVEIGWFDTTPYGENPPGFGGGAWTAWPFFESGMIVVSSMNEGLFIVRPQRPVT